jgi:hypothetical protein
MVLAWAAIGGIAGFQALEHGNITAATQIAWFVAGGAALGVVAMAIGRLFPGGNESGSGILGGVTTGAVALAALAAMLWKGTWGGMILMAGMGLIGGAVVGFGCTFFSLAIEAHRPWTILRDVLRNSDGR